MSTIGTILHRTLITGTNNPASQVSKNVWNDTMVVASAAPNGAVMVRDSAQPDGWGFNTDLPDGVVNALDFGADRTGVTDATVAINNALWYAHLNGAHTVLLPAGTYLCNLDDPIHLGYGANFYTSVTLQGEGSGYRGEFASTIIKTTRWDRMAINVQGGRRVRIRNLCVWGPNKAYLQGTLVGYEGSAVHVRDGANWMSPSGSNTAFHVHCAISIDAYAGPAPVDGYPTVTYPAVLGAVAQYDKWYSSDVIIDDCYLIGFVAGVVIQPCDADGNGDFVRLENTTIEYCRYGISVGNTQSRLVRLSYVLFTLLHTAIENQTHGRGPSVGQAGEFNSHVDSCEFRSIYQWFNLSTNISGPMVFTSCYCESVIRFGNARVGASRAAPLTFIGCNLQWSWQSTHRNFGIPGSLLDTDSSAHAITFLGCQFSSYHSVLCFFGYGEITFQGCSTWVPTGVWETSLAHKAVCNFTLGGIVLPLLGRGATMEVKTDQVYNLTTGGTIGGTAVPTRGTIDRSATREQCLNSFAQYAMPHAATDPAPFPVSVPVGYAIDKGTYPMSLSGLTATIPGISADKIYDGGIAGDVILDAATMSVFVITSETGGTATATLLNNYYLDASSVVQYLTAISLNTGSLYVRSTRHWVLPHRVYVAVTSGSAVLTTVQRLGDAHLDATWFPINDYLPYSSQDERIFTNGRQIAAIDVPARTVTASGNATRTESRLPIRQLVRSSVG